MFPYFSKFTFLSISLLHSLITSYFSLHFPFVWGHSITTWIWFCSFLTTYLPLRGHFLPWTWTWIGLFGTTYPRSYWTTPLHVDGFSICRTSFFLYIFFWNALSYNFEYVRLIKMVSFAQIKALDIISFKICLGFSCAHERKLMRMLTIVNWLI